MSISKYNLARVCSVLFSSTILIVNDTINCKNTNFRWLIYRILSFFVDSSQNMLQMLSKSALAASSKRLIHEVFSLLCSFTIRMVEVCQAFPDCMIGFPSGRRTLFLNRRSRQFFILHSSFFIRFTLTLTLTTETPINRRFQPGCEGVRATK